MSISGGLKKTKVTIEGYYAQNAPNETYKCCDTYVDFLEIIDRKDIDAVMISAPDIWHVSLEILAAKTKKNITNNKLANELLVGLPPRKGWEQYYKI